MTDAIKTKARAAVRRALSSGKLSKPDACELCGKKPDKQRNLHGHHYLGYGRMLDVQWLCVKCHFVFDPRPKGKANGRAKLSEQDVLNIRSRYRRTHRWNPDGSARSHAREFGVHASTIKRIVTKEIWQDAALSEGK